MSRYSASEQDMIRRDNRAMEVGGISMVGELDELFAAINAGSIGITASAAEVDAVAKGAAAGQQDTDTTTGLTFGYKAFRFGNGLANVTVAGGTIALTLSSTNYIEVDRAGTVSANTSGFTSGRLPLWTVVTGVSSITSVAKAAPLLTLIGTAGVVGSMLSTAGKTREVAVRVGTLSATSSAQIPLPSIAGTVSRVSVMVDTTVTQSDTDYWTFGVINKGAAGSGSTVVVNSATAANSTKSTGGAALTNFVQSDLTLTGTTADLDVTAKNVLNLTATKAGSAANLVGLTVIVEMTFTA